MMMKNQSQKEVYLLNAFSLQMIDTDRPFHLDGKPIKKEDLPSGLTSAIGHADTAAVISAATDVAGYICTSIDLVDIEATADFFMKYVGAFFKAADDMNSDNS